MAVFITLKSEGILQFLLKTTEVHHIMESRIDPESYTEPPRIAGGQICQDPSMSVARLTA